MKSKRGTQFRIRAIEILKEYMRKGFVLDDERLKNLGGGGYFKELLERIRDIRASEKVFYRQVLEIYATSIDYDPKAEISVQFSKRFRTRTWIKRASCNGTACVRLSGFCRASGRAGAGGGQGFGD